jgi:hypothetical protein
VVSTSAQAEKIMKRMTEEEWMTGLRRERRRPGYEIYQQPITAERKHTVQIHRKRQIRTCSEIFGVLL